jgi:hypothetical protein
MKNPNGFLSFRENYESFVCDDTLSENTLKYCEMHPEERRFLEALIKWSNPKNLLEIGISAGGGSRVMLKAMEKDAKLTSIDIGERWYRDPSFKVGFAVDEKTANGRWKLIAGKEPAQLMDSLKEKFDFCLIDTMHIHPVESLNFLTIFTHLAENAIVVLHDIGLYGFDPYGHFDSFPVNSMFACKLLYDTVTADKLEPNDYAGHSRFSNIGAFRISSDTQKYIRDVFSMLRFPWGIYPAKLPDIYAVLKKHYNEECMTLFEKSVVVNLPLLLHGGRGYDFSDMGDVFGIVYEYRTRLREILMRFDRLIFYGAGACMLALSDVFRMFDLRIPDEIWDIDDLKQGRSFFQKGGGVKAPDFSRLYSNDALIVTVMDGLISENVLKKTREAGCGNCFSLRNFHGLLDG